MKELIIYGDRLESQEELHEYMERELEFPEYYGGNLAALYDCLTDICEETRIEVHLEGVQDENLCSYLEQAARVMEDAASQNECLQVTVIG